MNYISIGLVLVLSLCIIITSCKSKDGNQSIQKEKIIEYPNGEVWTREYFQGSKQIKSEGIFRKDTIRTGFYRSYLLDNGLISFEANYKDGKLNGLYRSYFKSEDSNFVKSEGILKMGIPIGIWKGYYPNGQVECIVTYDSAGKEINNLCFTKDGEIRK